MRARRFALTAAVVAGTLALPLASELPAANAATTTYYRPADGVFHLAGHGYGHGHGMSQWGAYGGAQSGKTYQQILAWYYNSPAFGTATGSIKVQITSDGRGSDGRYDTQVKPASGLTATDSASHKLVLPAKASDGTAYDTYRAVILADGTFRVEAHRSSGWVALAPTGTGLTATSWTGWVRFTATGGILDLLKSSGTASFYRDSLELDKTSGAVGITVNRTSLEHYLAGVVSSEMPCSWTPTVNGTKRLDALESQAVAARSYAAWRRQHPRSSQVDIVDSTSDQAYFGYSAEKSALTACPWTNANGSKTSAEAAAVAATAGKVMVDASGNPIFAQYSASNGGFEISGGQTYLPSRPDAWDGVPTDSWSSHSWTDSFTAGQVQAAYPAVGTLTSVAVTSRENLSGTDQNGATVTEQYGGRILSMTLTGSAGSVTTTGASFAGALGLMSPWFTVVVSRPGAPGSVSAVAGDAQATVRWTTPSSDGGGGIRGYTITATPAITPVHVGAAGRAALVTGLKNDTSYVFSVAATNTAGTGPATKSAPVTPSARVVFHPIAPTRIYYTSTASSALAPGETRPIKVAGVGGIPSSGAIDVVVSVATLASTASGNLSVYPYPGPGPADPSLEWPKGQSVNTLIPVKVGTSGLINVHNNSAGPIRIVVDAEGYYTAATGSGDALTAASPLTLFDSTASGPVTAGSTSTMPVAGQGGVPANATAVVVQVTAINPNLNRYVRVWATGSTEPVPAQLYAPAGRTSDATAMVPLTGSGSLSMSPAATANVVVTLLGWFAPAASPPASGVTTVLTPTKRVLVATVPGRGTVTVAPTLPAGADAVLVNVIGIGPAGTPITVYALGGRGAHVGSLHLPGSPVSTTVLTPLGNDGAIAIHDGGRSSARVVIDVLAWTAS